MIKKLQVVQNKVVRFVLDLGPRSRINWDILDKVNMLSVTDKSPSIKNKSCVQHFPWTLMHLNTYVQIFI